MDLFLDACSLGGFLADVPDGLGIDRLITAVVAVARKQPSAGLAPQAVPMSTQFIEQLGAEHDIAIGASLAALDVNHHPVAVDVADFQTG